MVVTYLQCVVKYRSNVPTEEAKAALSTDLQLVSPSPEIIDKTIIFITMNQLFKVMMTKTHFGEKVQQL